MAQPVVEAVRGAAFAVAPDALYAINVGPVAFGIKVVGIGLAEDTSTLADASAGTYRERAAVV